MVRKDSWTFLLRLSKKRNLFVRTCGARILDRGKVWNSNRGGSHITDSKTRREAAVAGAGRGKGGWAEAQSAAAEAVPAPTKCVGLAPSTVMWHQRALTRHLTDSASACQCTRRRRQLTLFYKSSGFLK